MIKQRYLPFTVLKPLRHFEEFTTSAYELQQYLPFTVLKLISNIVCCTYYMLRLQQYLLLAVLKLSYIPIKAVFVVVATVLTACGIETCGMFYLTCHDDHVATYLPLAVLKLKRHLLDLLIHYFSCNSTYCLRY